MERKDKIVAFGEIMLRLTPPDYTTIAQARNYIANYGGCEANVLVSLSTKQLFVIKSVVANVYSGLFQDYKMGKITPYSQMFFSFS